MALFKKKPKIQGPVPIKEIQSLRNSGLSDREIIKRLKEKGYDEKEIERALLQSIRSEITSQKENIPPSESALSREGAPKFEDIYSGTSISSSLETFGGGPRRMPNMQSSMPSGSLEEDLGGLEDFGIGAGEMPLEGEETVSPEVTIEEIVEGILMEKWPPIEKEINALKSEQEAIKKEIMEIKEHTARSRGGESNINIAAKIKEIEERLNNLEPKVSGLEKAFKQFLPTLTDNIRMLSQIVEKMKEKSTEEKRYEFKRSYEPMQE